VAHKGSLFFLIGIGVYCNIVNFYILTLIIGDFGLEVILDISVYTGFGSGEDTKLFF